jgi:hypothetical protein
MEKGKLYGMFMLVLTHSHLKKKGGLDLGLNQLPSPIQVTWNQVQLLELKLEFFFFLIELGTKFLISFMCGARIGTETILFCFKNQS